MQFASEGPLHYKAVQNTVPIHQKAKDAPNAHFKRARAQFVVCIASTLIAIQYPTTLCVLLRFPFLKTELY